MLRYERLSYLPSVDRDGAGHDSLQVTAETNSFHRDDGLLSQDCSIVEMSFHFYMRKPGGVRKSHYIA